MKEFAQAVLGVPLHEGYGSTECGVVLVDGLVQSPPVTAWKLVDVPELGYHTDDHPHPRGELLVRTDDIFPGYYNRPEVTSSVFDDDGYYRTGDIMAQVGPDRLVYVDRRNNVQKLSQGEFVALSKVEAASPTTRRSGRSSSTATATGPTCSPSSSRRRSCSTASPTHRSCTAS